MEFFWHLSFRARSKNRRDSGFFGDFYPRDFGGRRFFRQGDFFVERDIQQKAISGLEPQKLFFYVRIFGKNPSDLATSKVFCSIRKDE